MYGIKRWLMALSPNCSFISRANCFFYALHPLPRFRNSLTQVVSRKVVWKTVKINHGTEPRITVQVLFHPPAEVSRQLPVAVPSASENLSMPPSGSDLVSVYEDAAGTE